MMILRQKLVNRGCLGDYWRAGARWLYAPVGWRLVLVLLGMVMASGCQTDAMGFNPSSGTNSPAGSSADVISQWAAVARASSYYGRPDWSPNRATGAADVSGCTDDARAWASARGNGVEWLELGYSHPVQAIEVRIYQTFGRGAVSRVTLIDMEGNSQVVWEGEDVTEPCPGVLVVRVEPTATKVDLVRIDLDESRTGFWNQIDAVELVGTP